MQFDPVSNSATRQLFAELNILPAAVQFSCADLMTRILQQLRTEPGVRQVSDDTDIPRVRGLLRLAESHYHEMLVTADADFIDAGKEAVVPHSVLIRNATRHRPVEPILVVSARTDPKNPSADFVTSWHGRLTLTRNPMLAVWRLDARDSPRMTLAYSPAALSELLDRIPDTGATFEQFSTQAPCLAHSISLALRNYEKRTGLRTPLRPQTIAPVPEFPLRYRVASATQKFDLTFGLTNHGQLKCAVWRYTSRTNTNSAYHHAVQAESQKLTVHHRPVAAFADLVLPPVESAPRWPRTSTGIATLEALRQEIFDSIAVQWPEAQRLGRRLSRCVVRIIEPREVANQFHPLGGVIDAASVLVEIRDTARGGFRVLAAEGMSSVLTAPAFTAVMRCLGSPAKPRLYVPILSAAAAQELWREACHQITRYKFEAQVPLVAEIKAAYHYYLAEAATAEFKPISPPPPYGFRAESVDDETKMRLFVGPAASPWDSGSLEISARWVPWGPPGAEFGRLTFQCSRS